MQIKYTTLLLFGLTILGCTSDHTPASGNASIQSLEQLTVATLRSREYGSTIHIKKKNESLSFESYLAAYDSDELQLYTRIDVPEGPPPEAGFPVVVFVHGWRGIDDAPALDFYYAPDSYYHEMIEGYRNAGFVVLVPGLRGHGTIDDIPADGIEYLAAWDNGTYLSPVFYAIDVLNLLDGLDTLNITRIDPQRVNISGHSQGGDTVLFALAIAGEGSKVSQPIHAASIWSGTFASRNTQLQTYAPMQKTPQAFMSGDGTWTGSAIASDNSVNPHFIFWYPADWIESVDRKNWTWQNESWSVPTVGEALRTKLDQMYDAINKGVINIDDATFTLSVSENQKAIITHDPRLVKAMSAIDAFDKSEFLSEPLALQYSDRDFYSFPQWNEALCEQYSQAENNCYPFEYAENTHSLGVSKYPWFSSENAVPGLPLALRRDTALFLGRNPNTVD